MATRRSGAHSASWDGNAPNRSLALRRTGGVDAQGYRHPEPGFVSFFFQAPQIHVRRSGKADKEFCGAEIWSALVNLRLTLRWCVWVRFEVGVVDATGTALQGNIRFRPASVTHQGNGQPCIES